MAECIEKECCHSRLLSSILRISGLKVQVVLVVDGLFLGILLGLGCLLNGVRVGRLPSLEDELGVVGRVGFVVVFAALHEPLIETVNECQ